MDWQRVLSAGAEIMVGAANGVTANQWLQVNDQEAYQSIAAFIQNRSIEEIDLMDSVLLTMASTKIDFAARRRLVKFYAFYKAVEFQRFGTWRGFPPEA